MKPAFFLSHLLYRGILMRAAVLGVWQSSYEQYCSSLEFYDRFFRISSEIGGGGCFLEDRCWVYENRQSHREPNLSNELCGGSLTTEDPVSCSDEAGLGVCEGKVLVCRVKGPYSLQPHAV